MSDKAIFLDRDGTLIEDPGYINDPGQVQLLDGVAEVLGELRAMGYKIVIVSNQSGVARGIVTERVLDEIHNRLKELLAEKGAFLDRIYCCPYHPEGIIPKYRKESDWRKPSPGMLLAAAGDMDIDLSWSWVIGNSGRDVEAGLRAGCKTILIDNPSHTKINELGAARPDYKAVNMKEAVNIIKKHTRSSDGQAVQTQSVQPQSVPMSQPVVCPAGRPEPELQTAEMTHQQQTGDTFDKKAERLLTDILEQLKSIQRTNMFDEFSIMKVMAGIVQIIALFCLLISIWFLMSPTRQDNSVLISLGFAVVLQVMALTLFVMQGRK